MAATIIPTLIRKAWIIENESFGVTPKGCTDQSVII
jgi:hypothetical protein